MGWKHKSTLILHILLYCGKIEIIVDKKSCYDFNLTLIITFKLCLKKGGLTWKQRKQLSDLFLVFCKGEYANEKRKE